MRAPGMRSTVRTDSSNGTTASAAPASTSTGTPTRDERSSQVDAEEPAGEAAAALDGAVGADRAHGIDVAPPRLGPEVRAGEHEAVPRVAAESFEELPIERRELGTGERPVGGPATRAVEEHDGRHSLSDDLGPVHREAQSHAAAH